MRRLARVVRTAANARRLAELTARFEFTGDSPDPLSEPVRLDRTNTTFHDLHRLARLFLTGDWQSTTGGKSTGFTLLFPMNELFERFIGQSLKRAVGAGWRVSLPGPQVQRVARRRRQGRLRQAQAAVQPATRRRDRRSAGPAKPVLPSFSTPNGST